METGLVREGRSAAALSLAVILALLLVWLAGATTANAAFLSFVEVQRDGVAGVDGLDATFSVALSPDGANVYAAASADSAIAVFGRDAASGRLSFVEAEKEGVGGVSGMSGARSVTVSPEGAHVYAASSASSAVAVFGRSPGTGALTFVEAERDGVGGVDGLSGTTSLAVSPDGKHVYATGFSESALAVFSRDPATGALAPVGVYRDNVGGADGLQQPIFVTVSPDNAHVYVGGVSANDGVAVYSRNATTGALSFVELYTSSTISGLGSVSSIALSADGRFAYTAGSVSLYVFSRDATTGKLSYLEAFRDSFDGVDGLFGAVSAAVSPDGAAVYVASQSDNGVGVFGRNTTTGRLTYVEAHKDGVGGVTGLQIAQAVAVSPDSQHVYVGSQLGDAVAVFNRGGSPSATDTPTSSATATSTTTATTGTSATSTATATSAPISHLPLVVKPLPPTATPTATATSTQVSLPSATPTSTTQAPTSAPPTGLVEAVDIGTTTVGLNDCRVSDPRAAPITLPAGSTSIAYQVTVKVPDARRVAVDIEPSLGGGTTETGCNGYRIIGGQVYQNKFGGERRRSDGQPIPPGNYKLVIVVDGVRQEVPFTVGR